MIRPKYSTFDVRFKNEFPPFIFDNVMPPDRVKFKPKLSTSSISDSISSILIVDLSKKRNLNDKGTSFN